ncbi:MAG: hypothetical protein M3Z31_18160 [Pseudomonadota bacterium]|nr:hypothetical protein [Pseudomonadota bacterium]
MGTRLRLLVMLVMGATTLSCHAQNCLGRPDFDKCMASSLARSQASLSAQQRQTWNNYLRQYGPWLREQYKQYRGPMTFEQFAYWNLMTANGTNVGGAVQAQQNWFNGQQKAYGTVQQGNEIYRQGMYDNSNRTSRTAERYNQGAVRGNTAQVDPRTGQTSWLPYNAPYNQAFTYNGQNYWRNERGYSVWDNGNWVLMQPSR